MTEHYTTTAHRDDDFPVPELTAKERKQIFLEEFVKYLNSCALVITTGKDTTSTYRQYEFRYGNFLGATLIASNEQICSKRGHLQYPVRILSIQPTIVEP